MKKKFYCDDDLEEALARGCKIRNENWIKGAYVHMVRGKLVDYTGSPFLFDVYLDDHSLLELYRRPSKRITP